MRVMFTLPLDWLKFEVGPLIRSRFKGSKELMDQYRVGYMDKSQQRQYSRAESNAYGRGGRGICCSMTLTGMSTEFVNNSCRSKCKEDRRVPLITVMDQTLVDECDPLYHL
ncbi:hypothetical protein AB6A40_000711 [Gnathostoma spinigerum]|uniref:Uncharacterized protein n=1 Tax=Gnathostoma spinigerum TaxID=75299 RepID=A0ABD6EBY3_9BILA